MACWASALHVNYWVKMNKHNHHTRTIQNAQQGTTHHTRTIQNAQQGTTHTILCMLMLSRICNCMKMNHHTRTKFSRIKWQKKHSQCGNFILPHCHQVCLRTFNHTEIEHEHEIQELSNCTIFVLYRNQTKSIIIQSSSSSTPHTSICTEGGQKATSVTTKTSRCATPGILPALNQSSSSLFIQFGMDTVLVIDS
jgi:hypothetical protein